MSKGGVAAEVGARRPGRCPGCDRPLAPTNAPPRDTALLCAGILRGASIWHPSIADDLCTVSDWMRGNGAVPIPKPFQLLYAAAVLQHEQVTDPVAWLAELAREWSART